LTEVRDLQLSWKHHYR